MKKTSYLKPKLLFVIKLAAIRLPTKITVDFDQDPLLIK